MEPGGGRRRERGEGGKEGTASRKKKPALVGWNVCGRSTSAVCHGSGKNRRWISRSASEKKISLRVWEWYHPTAWRPGRPRRPNNSASRSWSRSDSVKDGPNACSHSTGAYPVIRSRFFWKSPSRMPPISTPPRGTEKKASTTARRMSSSTLGEYSMVNQHCGALHETRGLSSLLSIGSP